MGQHQAQEQAYPAGAERANVRAKLGKPPMDHEADAVSKLRDERDESDAGHNRRDARR